MPVLEKIELQTPAIPAGASPALVIAEVGVNHNGRLDLALASVEAAFRAGANAVKFQTFKAERLAAPTAPQAGYQRRRPDSRSAPAAAKGGQLEMLKALELSEADFSRIRDHCERQGVEFLSTPFDPESAAFLRDLGVRRFKVGSGDLTNVPLLKRLGGFRLPVILSTGMAVDGEIAEAIEALEEAGAPEITLLHCISQYPAPPESLQLRRIPWLRDRFGRPVGYSDHSLGHEAALGARALGAMVIEKHLTLDRSLPGPDHAASADPAEFAELVKRLRLLETMLGGGERVFQSEEEEIRAVARKSIVALRPIRQGERLEERNIGILRPGTGIAPRHWEEVLGRRAARDINAGEPLEWRWIA
ncbi:MAG: N-acetylneuraminate synthase [Planctomycetes bacterium]|nr:N-acetylneuraminate synthase [Planctomycetota bacterium]